MFRRSLGLGALAAPLLLRGTPAAAQTAPAPIATPGFYRFKVGSLTVTTLLDGIAPRANPTQGLILNASAEQVAGALQAGFLSTESMPNPFTPTLVDTGRGHVLIDTGLGDNGAPGTGRLLERLAATGLHPSVITTVVISHFHGDHISGLSTRDGRALFPNAEVVVPAAEWRYWTDAGEESRAPANRKPGFALVKARFAPYAGRIRQVGDGAEVAHGIRAIATHGHTPGHTSYQIADGNAVAVVAADLTGRPELNLVNPGWHSVFDQDATMAEQTRRRLFDRAAADRVRVIGYHWGFPANGHVARTATGYRMVPADWAGTV